MAGSFTASVRENPGRQFLVVEFRHPLRNDASNRRGKKIRKGLGTADRDEAEILVAQLNESCATNHSGQWVLAREPSGEASTRAFWKSSMQN